MPRKCIPGAGPVSRLVAEYPGLIYAAQLYSYDITLTMPAAKPFLILQLRPEDDTSKGEFEAILKYGELDEKNKTFANFSQS